MSSEDVSTLIDRIAANLRPHLGDNDDAADAVATAIVGDITSEYMVIRLPRETEEAMTRAALDALEIPGLRVGGGRS